MQLLLGHAKLESVVKYPRVEVDNALEAAEQTEVTRIRAPVAAVERATRTFDTCRRRQ